MTITIREIAGQQMIDSRGTALLYGVDPCAIEALPIVAGAMRIPHMWIKRGRRRAREAMAATGSESYVDCLQYWARRDYNAELELVYR
ncbi:hypothetical protein [Mycobacterium camsae]|uniref:hypothetical protein n=1 Tax=Mycobacterium gordonae TaxID=1778 RepID=UPI00197D82A2|nr:hypothetical protein [Mycobacterium gordonae]